LLADVALDDGKIILNVLQMARGDLVSVIPCISAGDLERAILRPNLLQYGILTQKGSGSLMGLRVLAVYRQYGMGIVKSGVEIDGCSPIKKCSRAENVGEFLVAVTVRIEIDEDRCGAFRTSGTRYCKPSNS
jgi:hypothetical protein